MGEKNERKKIHTQQDLDQTVADWKNRTKTVRAELSSETEKRNGLDGKSVGMELELKALWKNDQRSEEQAREERQFAREVAETVFKLGRFLDDKTEDVIDAHIELDSVMMTKVEVEVELQLELELELELDSLMMTKVELELELELDSVMMTKVVEKIAANYHD